MKRYLLLLCPLLMALTPAPLGVTDPDYACDFDKGFCVVKAEVLKELVNETKRPCIEARV